MKKISKFKFLLAFAAILLLSCEQSLIYEEPLGMESSEERKSAFAKLLVAPEEIPDVMDALLERTGAKVAKGSKGHGKIVYNKSEILLDEVIAVSEKGAGTNYTFPLLIHDSPWELFHNLIIKKAPDGRITEMHIIEYEMADEDFARFLESDEDYRYFIASFRRYSFDDFFNNTKIGQRTDCPDSSGQVGGSGSSNTPPGGTFVSHQNGTGTTSTFSTGVFNHDYTLTVTVSDPATGAVDAASTTATSQSATTVFNPPGVETGTTTVMTFDPEVASVNQVITSGSGCITLIQTRGDGVVIGKVKFCPEAGPSTNKGSMASKLGDCPDGSGGVAISNAAKPVRKLDAYLGGLTPQQINYFNADANISKAQRIVLFIKEEDFTEQAKEFAKKAIDALLEGGSVNFEEQIINSIDHPCAAEVVNEANAMDNEIIKILKESFGTEDSPNLIYLDDIVPQSGSGTTLGVTDPLTDQNGKIFAVTITLDSEYLTNATDISIFSTTIHENIHAYMYAQLSNGGINIGDSNLDYSILADEWSKFVAKRKAGIPQDEIMTYLTSAQHQIIGDMVALNASIISEYAESKGYPISEFRAEALAWAGLKESVAWSLLDQELKETYTNLIDYDANVTGFEMLAIGRPCK